MMTVKDVHVQSTQQFGSTELRLEILDVFALLRRYQTANGVAFLICGPIGNDRFVKNYEEKKKNYNM